APLHRRDPAGSSAVRPGPGSPAGGPGSPAGLPRGHLGAGPDTPVAGQARGGAEGTRPPGGKAAGRPTGDAERPGWRVSGAGPAGGGSGGLPADDRTEAERARSLRLPGADLRKARPASESGGVLRPAGGGRSRIRVGVSPAGGIPARP